MTNFDRTQGAVRDPKWEALEKSFLKGKVCSACGKKTTLNAHHILPFHKYPDEELDPTNLVALCRDCHLNIGHAKHWPGWNPDVVSDAATFLQRVKNSLELAKS